MKNQRRGLKASAMAFVAVAAPLAIYEWAKSDYEVMRTVAGLALMFVGFVGVVFAGRWYDNSKR